MTNTTTINAVAEAIESAIETINNLYEQGDWDNGVYDPTGSICEGIVQTARYVSETIAKLKDAQAAIEAYEKKQTTYVCIHSPEQCKQTVREMTVGEYEEFAIDAEINCETGHLHKDVGLALAKLGTIRIVEK